MSEPDLIIVLVHGTFARNAEWVAEGSTFVARLKGGLGGINTMFPEFGWSGINSRNARSKAASDLNALLQDSMIKNCKSKVFIVGHSHGGNIALQALHLGGFTRPISGVVTMGTPFISCRARDIGKRAVFASQIIAFIAAIVALALASLLIPVDDSQIHIGWFRAIPLVFLFSGIGLHLWMKKRLKSLITDWAIDRQTRLTSSMNYMGELPPLLCSTAIDDEAGRWLSLLRSLTNASGLPFYLLTRYKRVGLVIAGALIALGIVVAMNGKPWGESIAEWAVGITFFAYLLSPVILAATIVAPVFLRSHPLGFGREALMDSWLIDMIVSPTPLGRACETLNISHPSRRSAKGQLIHSSFFEDPDFAPFIGEWMVTPGLRGARAYSASACADDSHQSGFVG